jgi:predicted RNA-binding Zn-ribbon protein involved in translation (DUF1610 family)
MAGQAELFTVCSSCGQQVSTFVTECPYCGTRLRQRAPRLDRKDGDLEALLRLPTHEPDRTLKDDDAEDDVVIPLKKRRKPLGGRVPRSSTTKARKAPRQRSQKRRSSYATEGKAYATFTIVLLALVGLPLEAILELNDLALYGDQPAWRAVTAALTYDDSWNALAVLTTFGVFGWLWERRAGWIGSVVVLIAFFGAGVGGLLVDRAVDDAVVAFGGAGSAIALATAWIVCEIRDRRAGQSLDGDLLGAATLLAVPIATTALTADTIPTSIGVGLAVGGVLGLGLSLAKK